MSAVLRAVLFDLDDTLYDFRAHWGRQLRQALQLVAQHHPELAVEPLVAAGLAEQVYIDRLPGFLRRCGVRDAELIAVVHAEYRRRWFDELALPDETAATLATLRPHVRLGLVTNGPARTQRPKIARFGLAELMDTLIVSEEVGLAKPDPAIFRLALAQLGVAADEALFVGDAPEYDLCGAAAAGVRAVWLNPRGEALPQGTPPPWRTIGRLSELAGLVDALRASSPG